MTAVGVAAFLSACGGSDGANGTNGLTPLVTLSVVGSGAQCANGGSKLEAGLDSNTNGILDSSEITSMQFVCNGANGALGPVGPAGSPGAIGPIGPIGPTGATGAPGIATLIVMSDATPGSKCSNGGKTISVGADKNGNGALDANEIAYVDYICNGATGPTGAAGPIGATGDAGAPGIATLIVMSDVAPGSSCLYGGKKISIGADSNRNGVLDVVEIVSFDYVCNGATGDSAWRLSVRSFSVVSASGLPVLGYAHPKRPSFRDRLLGAHDGSRFGNTVVWRPRDPRRRRSGERVYLQ